MDLARRLVVSLWGVAIAATMLAGCASAPPTHGATASCTRWFERLDAAIDAAGVRDVEADRIPGFAGLRVDRETAARRDEPFERWLARLIALDETGQRVEIANLGAGRLPDRMSPAQALRSGAACRAAWADALAHDDAARARLLEAARVPDRYATVQRALGLYAIVRWPFFSGVGDWQQRHAQAMQAWRETTPALTRFAPAVPSEAAPRPSPSVSARPAAPAAVPDAEAVWLARWAPMIGLEAQAAAGDRFGELRRDARDTATVDTAHPLLYTRTAHMRVAGRWLPQLVYTLWFPERPAESAFDPIAGHLDAVILRLTLSEDGERVLMLDTIHACGCFQLFVPAPGVVPRPGPDDEEWLFAPATLPMPRAGERYVVELRAGDHQLMHVGVAATASTAARYALRDDATLRTLPRAAPGADGATRSLYGPDGIVAGSERGERWLFWPMGIASAGAMRQWGHHATAFVGRRHFDDADLLDRRFAFPTP